MPRLGQITHSLMLLLGVAVISASHAMRAQAGECPAFRNASRGLPTAGEWRTHPALGDVNEDGKLDIAGHPRKGRGPMVWLGDGKGGWELSTKGLAIPGMSCGVGVDFADVNGDGHLDIGIADHCQGLFVFLGDGAGGWRIGEGNPIGGRLGYQDLEFADLDGDGHQDLIAIGAFRGGFAVFGGDGSGKWRKRETGLPDTGFGRDVKLADINGDGVLDVAASFTTSIHNSLAMEIGTRLIWVANGSGKYVPSSEGIAPDRQYRGVALGDIDNDGLLDLAASEIGGRTGESPLHVYKRTAAGSWSLAGKGLPLSEQGLSFSGVALADLDGDGNSDLIALTWLDGAIRIWLGDGAGGWEECTEAGLPSDRIGIRGHGVNVGDVNGDGRPDIAAGFGRRGAGMLEVWIQE